MGRLIDADELCEGRVENDPVRIAVECAPSVDAVPVVRCKDCWKNGTEECAMHIECDCGMYSWNEADDFCSWGEREDNGKID